MDRAGRACPVRAQFTSNSHPLPRPLPSPSPSSLSLAPPWHNTSCLWVSVYGVAWALTGLVCVHDHHGVALGNMEEPGDRGSGLDGDAHHDSSVGGSSSGMAASELPDEAVTLSIGNLAFVKEPRLDVDSMQVDGAQTSSLQVEEACTASMRPCNAVSGTMELDGATADSMSVDASVIDSMQVDEGMASARQEDEAHEAGAHTEQDARICSSMGVHLDEWTSSIGEEEGDEEEESDGEMEMRAIELVSWGVDGDPASLDLVGSEHGIVKCSKECVDVDELERSVVALLDDGKASVPADDSNVSCKEEKTEAQTGGTEVDGIEEDAQTFVGMAERQLKVATDNVHALAMSGEKEMSLLALGRVDTADTAATHHGPGEDAGARTQAEGPRRIREGEGEDPCGGTAGGLAD